MRWSNLLVDAEQAQTLPGYRDPAVVRRFDAPEALDTRFYEVHAKSALNKVPPQSRMFFRWTINPYRGCSHACSYCVSGATPVLLRDGRTRPIADLRVGDAIYGTVREGAYRRYRETQVLAHWETRNEGFRVVLEDGTELVASGDHRFLTARGWKYVTGTEQGAGRRAHLTTNDKLMGFGGFAPGPPDSEEYRRGYLCGVIRGDGHVGSYSYERAGRAHGDVHRFRLALADIEALRRTRDYLGRIGIGTDEFLFSAAAGPHREVRAIRTSARDRVDAVREAIRWPGRVGDDWCRGFLAGIFDAEGCYSRGILRISNTDPEILDWTTWCLRRIGVASALERTGHENGLCNVRVLGGLPAHMRFFHSVDPAIARKRDIEGRAIKSDAPLGVAAVEPLGRKVEMYDITTGTGDFIADGVVSHNCFARPTHTFLDFDAGRDFEKEIVVKVNLPEVLRAELARPSWKREHVALGTNTDPYQWVEGRYKLMPEVWRALLESGTPCSLLTKSPLMLRDIELMKELARTAGFTANVSVPTLDEKAWRATEPHTPHPRKRLEALGELNRAGIPTGVLIAPLMPGINDSPEQVERILELAAENGAGSVSGITLHLRGEVRDVFMGWLRSQRPDLVEHYERLYRRGAYAPTAERERHAKLVRLAREKVGAAGRPDPAPGRAYPAAERRPPAIQESLF
ncbi:MAG TPA: radical SAM protein [Solirubrobacteraceae bacterium]|nr:radical SAM protein [Solirubrobacteraceae bacterium]